MTADEEARAGGAPLRRREVSAVAGMHVVGESDVCHRLEAIGVVVTIDEDDLFVCPSCVEEWWGLADLSPDELGEEDEEDDRYEPGEEEG